jgi:4'-phosphopantetheinyl transferase
LLGRYGNTPSDKIEFASLLHGKPVCRELQPIDFNVSHSGMLALIAITRGQAVGVDIERVRTDLEFLEIGKQVFTGAELRELAQIAPDRRASAFFDLWVRKEAYLKYTGEGFMGSPEKIHLGWPRRQAEIGLQAAGRMIHSFATAPDYASAFALGTKWSRARFLGWKLEME